MAWFKKKNKSDDGPAAASTAASASSEPLSPTDQANGEAAAARLEIYRRFGDVHEDVLAPLISSHLTGQAPAWPSREAHRVVAAGDGTMIFITDGLTDTFQNGEPGLGYEIAMKVPTTSSGDLAEAMSSPFFPLHQEFAFNALVWPDLRPMLAESGAMSMVLPADDHQSAFRSDGPEGSMVGALIGPANLTTTADPVMIVPITLILPAELKALEAGGPETRPALAQALVGAGVGWTSNPDRAPVTL